MVKQFNVWHPLNKLVKIHLLVVEFPLQLASSGQVTSKIQNDEGNLPGKYFEIYKDIFPITANATIQTGLLLLNFFLNFQLVT